MKMRNVFAALIAALSIGAGIYLASVPTLAQQVPSARQNTTQQTNYYRKTVNFSDGYNSGNTSLRIGRLPSNAFITRYTVQVSTAFNGTGANRVYLGAGNFSTTNAATATISAANYVLAAQTDGGIAGTGLSWTSGTVGFANILTSANLGTRLTSGGEVDLWANFAGTSATAGAVTFTIEYIPDNDG